MFALISVAFALDVDTFTTGATTGDPAAFTRLGAVDVGEAGAWDAGVVLDYANAPLSEEVPTGRTPVIAALATADVTGGYSFGGLRLDGTLPVHLGVDASDTASTWLASGDARVGLQLAIPHVAGLTLGSTLVLPTGADALYVGGPGRLVVAARAGAELGRVGVILLAGGVVSLPEEVRGLTAGLGPALGAGVAYRVSDALSLDAEVNAQGEWGGRSIPVEATLSARTRLAGGVWADAGAAAGIGSGVGASRWRIVVGLGYSGGRDARPTRATSSADADGDGLPDDVDACPEEAETVDGIQDEDGCPEVDGDADGVAFAVDACPDQAILPGQDPSHSDGCPHVVELADDHLALTQTIFFREGRAELLESAEPVLAAVRDAMVAHPEIQLFLIEGHTNTDGSAAYNVRLSDARAFTVMRWLVAHGIDANRLVSKGFGESIPLVPDSAPDALAANRRVEFRVLHLEEIPADARHVEVPADAR